MTTVSTPISNTHLDFIDQQVKKGAFDNRSQFIRDAIKRRIEEREIEEIKEASRLAKLGEVFEGNLDMLAKKYA